MQLGISTALFFFQDLLEHLPVFQESGFRSVEICPGVLQDGRVLHYDWRDKPGTEKLQRRLAELNLSVSSVHAPYSTELDPADPDPMRREAVLEQLCGVARVLKSFGGKTLVLHIAVNEFPAHDKAERERRLGYVRDLLPPLVEEIRSLGLILALENLLPHLLGGNVETLKSLLAPYKAEDVGICFDTSHANLWGRPSIYEMLSVALPRLVSLHVSDNRGRYDDHFVPGEGNIDWRRIVAMLREARYEGPAVLEVFKSANESASRPDVARAAFQKAREFFDV